MKNRLMQICLFITVLFIYGNSFAQPFGRDDFPRDGMPPRERFEQMEKLKLIEVLKMNETVTLKFFARRGESMERMKKLAQQRESLMEEIEQKFKKGDFESDDKYYKAKIDKVLEAESKMLEERKSFIYSLDDILTKEQILQFVIFEFRVKREIMDQMRDPKR
ncbi:MAG: hypothetical protein V1773_08970 [bacterium]